MINLLVNLIVWLLVVGILWYILVYALDAIPVPDPPNRLIKVVITVVMCLVILLAVLNLIGVSTGVDLPKLGTG